MKFDSVEKWLRCDKPEKYDFVEDTCEPGDGEHDYAKIHNRFKRFFVYRAHWYKKDHDKYLNDNEVEKVWNFCEDCKKYKSKDPDTDSQLLQKIYDVLYPELKEKDFMRQKSGICSDTMTSAQNAVSAVMKGFLKDKKISDVYRGKKAYPSTKSSIALAATKDGVFYDLLQEKCSNLETFLGLYHTIGNYCPVPNGFNCARSGPGRTADHDYWDLTLIKIREWYDANAEQEKSKVLQELLHTKEAKSEAISNCQKWLKFFGEGIDGWKNFVKKLYMQDYVKTDEEGWPVDPFWEGHSWNNFGFPLAPGKIDEGLKTINDRILARARKIVEN